MIEFKKFLASKAVQSGRMEAIIKVLPAGRRICLGFQPTSKASRHRKTKHFFNPPVILDEIGPKDSLPASVAQQGTDGTGDVRPGVLAAGESNPATGADAMDHRAEVRDSSARRDDGVGSGSSGNQSALVAPLPADQGP